MAAGANTGLLCRLLRLHYVLGQGQAIQYGVGVGRPGFTWSGTKTVSMKREWPDWSPPTAMLRRRPDFVVLR
jgi:lipoprotein-anchoring transpeptidase ErfK/SrfK